ncbi:beta-1,3-galactosyltransferase 5-like [Tachypleus tridentatus]|uniref:beta-1,3-galactosyltransferase 5-like n=1 Tax=Tachypleus tridentatus TaxID=6853 RepID=UPI003FD465D7
MKVHRRHDRRRGLGLVVISLSILNFLWVVNFYISRFSSSQEELFEAAPQLTHNLSFLNDSEDFGRLVDHLNFNFLLNNKQCDTSSDIFMLVFIHSAPEHYHNRQTIRQTWGLETNLGNDSFRVVFLVGEVQKQSVQLILEEENKVNRDIIQGNFIDSYRNLSYKYVMGLKWVTYFCRQARYVLKTDDDVFIDIYQLVRHIKVSFEVCHGEGLVVCFLLKKPYVKRSQRSKWRVSFSEYPGTYYPSYCSGWAVLMSPLMVYNLYRQSSRVPYFWVDDVHVTGTLVKLLGVKHIDITIPMSVKKEYVTSWLENNDTSLPPPFGYFNLSPEIIHALWTKTLLYYNKSGTP